MIENPDHRHPLLRRCVNAPVLARDGTLLDQPGFYPDYGILHIPVGFQRVTAPTGATHRDAIDAVASLRDEFYVDFPFADDGSRAHALSFLLLPFVRECIDGRTPLHIFNATVAGTGKSLLASESAHIYMGRLPALTTQSFGTEHAEMELRRKLHGLLASAPEFVIFDNVRDAIDSGVLAAYLTGDSIADRTIRSSQVPAVNYRPVWAATGNNVRTSGEIARRSVFINLDANEANPHLRETFRHPNLHSWIAANRPSLLRPLLTIITAWCNAGMPKSSATLGSYEAWAGVMSGLLEFVGVKGFLSANQPSPDRSQVRDHRVVTDR